ncbi:MarR family transcriptional regulator [Natrialba swarupiae]|nr:MarR family transcriptional regulator [Natrialba swarupiae]
MADDNIQHRQTDSPTGDIAYLARSRHRIPALVALTERPRSRSELCELTGVSDSTIRRTLDEFEDQIWIRKDGYQYTATRLGEVIASGMEELIERVETARKLRDVWHWLPDEVGEFPVEMWTDLTVTVADPDSPYRPVNRFEFLLRGDCGTIPTRRDRPDGPCFDVLRQRINDGVDVTVIGRPNCNAYFYSNYPEHNRELLQRDNFTVLEYDDLPPYGIGLLDERVIISCYEQGSGTVRALVDTDVPSVHEWAQSIYERYTSDAHPFDPQSTVE